MKKLISLLMAVVLLLSVSMACSPFDASRNNLTL